MAFNKFMEEFAVKNGSIVDRDLGDEHIEVAETPQECGGGDTVHLGNDGADAGANLAPVGPQHTGLLIETLIDQTNNKLRQWLGNHFCYVDGVAVCASCLESCEVVYDQDGQKPVLGQPAYCGTCIDLARENDPSPRPKVYEGEPDGC
jgi:hypothetical protein